MSRALELAKERGLCASFTTYWPALESFYAASRADALREAAEVCRSEYVDAERTGEESDTAYNLACDHCAAAILALIQK